MRSVANIENNVIAAKGIQALPGRRAQLRHDLNGSYPPSQGGQQRSQITATRAHFQHMVTAGQMQFLQGARLKLGLPHGRTVAQGDFHISESHFPHAVRHEMLTADMFEQVQNPTLEHFAWAYLLFYHVKPRLFHVQHFLSSFAWVNWALSTE